MILQIATIAGAAQWAGVPSDSSGNLMDFQPTKVSQLGENWCPVIYGWNYNTNGATTHQINVDIRPTAAATADLRVPLYTADTTNLLTQVGQKGGTEGCICVPVNQGVPYVLVVTTVGKAETSSFTLWWGWREQVQ